MIRRRQWLWFAGFRSWIFVNTFHLKEYYYRHRQVCFFWSSYRWLKMKNTVKYLKKINYYFISTNCSNLIRANSTPIIKFRKHYWLIKRNCKFSEIIIYYCTRLFLVHIRLMELSSWGQYPLQILGLFNEFSLRRLE